MQVSAPHYSNVGGGREGEGKRGREEEEEEGYDQLN